MSKVFNIATAAIVNKNHQVLLVRKKDSDAFMLPGGKIEEGETSLQALTRELGEELSADLSANRFSDLGHFRDVAANEAGFEVAAEVFVTRFEGHLDPKAEIEELRWFDPNERDDVNLAPLLQNHVLAALEQYLDQSGIAAGVATGAAL